MQNATTSAPADGSRTVTIVNDPPRQDGDECVGSSQPTGVLRLRPKRTGTRVVWGEGVIDNEHAGKKKSKICCIYHKPKRYDESSSESDTSDEDDRFLHAHDHCHDNQASHRPSQQPREESEVQTLEPADDAEPNAYERGPSGSTWKGKRKAAS